MRFDIAWPYTVTLRVTPARKNNLYPPIAGTVIPDMDMMGMHMLVGPRHHTAWCQMGVVSVGRSGYSHGSDVRSRHRGRE